MDFKEHKKSICLLIVLCMLLFGMCPNGVGADSFFPRANSEVSFAGNLFSESTIQPYKNGVPAQQAYTRESSIQYETALAPRQTVLKSNSHLGKSSCFILSGADILPRFFAGLGTADSHKIFAEIISNTVIISYIHRQDGEKAQPYFFQFSII